MTNHKRGCQNKYVKHTSKRAVTDVCCFYLLKIIMCYHINYDKTPHSSAKHNMFFLFIN